MKDLDGEILNKAKRGLLGLHHKILGLLFIIFCFMGYSLVSRSLNSLENLTASEYDMGIKKVTKDEDGTVTTRYGFVAKSAPKHKPDLLASIGYFHEKSMSMEIQRRVQKFFLPGLLPENTYVGIQLIDKKEEFLVGAKVTVTF